MCFDEVKVDFTNLLTNDSHTNISISHYKMVPEIDEFHELYDVTFKIYTQDVRLPENSLVFIYIFVAYLCCKFHPNAPWVHREMLQ